MHDDEFEPQLPDELRDIADGLRQARSVPDGHLLERVARRVMAAGAPAPKGFSARLRPRLAAGVAVAAVAAVLVGGGLHGVVPGAPGGISGFSLASLVSTSSSTQPTGSASDDTYCDDDSDDAPDCMCPTPPPAWSSLSPFWAKYSVFALNYAGNQVLNFDSGTYFGGIGITQGATLILQHADQFNNSTIYLATGAKLNEQGTPSGAPSIEYGATTSGLDKQLADDRTSLISLSNTFANSTASPGAAMVSYPNGISNTNGQSIVINGGPGVNVINVQGNVTLTAPLILQGSQNSFFVLNIHGNINLQGSTNGSGSAGAIEIGDGAPQANLVVNVIGVHSIYSDRNGEQIQGTLLGPDASGANEFAGSYGAVYIGGNFEFQSYPTIHGQHCP